MNQPITRVVKLSLHPQHIDAFKVVFASHKMHIAQFDGCLELNAYQDNKQPEIFFTISRWQTEHYLDNYRYSDFFKTLWSVVKPMFAAKAEAYSMTVV